METAHRKIELQSPADLTYLINNATRAAREKIDLHFPPSAAPETGDDAMKQRVEELVHAYIQATFSNAKPNLSINGLEGEEMEEALRQAATSGEELEPYDTRLASRILKLSSNIEALQLQLANLRRTAPAQAAKAYSQRISDEERAFDLARQEAEREKISTSEKAVAEGLGQERMLRWNEVERNWQNGTKVLGEVMEGIGNTTARARQAQDAVEFLDKKEG